MHAVVMHEFGAPTVLRAGELPDPAARPGWVTVALRASALNWHDVLVRQGRYGSPLPHVIGADGAGVRTDTGEEVVVLPSLHWGERNEAPGSRFEILGDRTPGTYAELVSVPVECLAAKPAGMSWAEAAALPLVGVTTYRALFTRGRLHAGESMLVIGAGGGVASPVPSVIDEPVTVRAGRHLGKPGPVGGAPVVSAHLPVTHHVRNLPGFDGVYGAAVEAGEEVSRIHSSTVRSAPPQGKKHLLIAASVRFNSAWCINCLIPWVRGSDRALQIFPPPVFQAAVSGY